MSKFSLLWIVVRVLIWLYIQKFSPTSTFFQPSQRSCENNSWQRRWTSQPNQHIKDGHLRNSRWLLGSFPLWWRHHRSVNTQGVTTSLEVGKWLLRAYIIPERQGVICGSEAGGGEGEGCAPACWPPQRAGLDILETHQSDRLNLTMERICSPNQSAANSCALFHLCPRNFTW